jgi:hypothetical protein
MASLELNNIVPGKTYKLVVRSIDSEGNYSPNSQIITFTAPITTSSGTQLTSTNTAVVTALAASSGSAVGGALTAGGLDANGVANSGSIDLATVWNSTSAGYTTIPALTGTASAGAVIINSTGILGYSFASATPGSTSSGQAQFFLSNANGNAYFRGTVYAGAGQIGNFKIFNGTLTGAGINIQNNKIDVYDSNNNTGYYTELGPDGYGGFSIVTGSSGYKGLPGTLTLSGQGNALPYMYTDQGSADQSSLGIVTSVHFFGDGVSNANSSSAVMVIGKGDPNRGGQSLGGNNYGDGYVVINGQSGLYTDWFGANKSSSVTLYNNIGNLTTAIYITAQGYGAGNTRITGSNIGYRYRESGSSTYALYSSVSHAAYTGGHIQLYTTRTSNSAFDFISAYANSAGDLKFHVRGDGALSSDIAATTPAADYAEYFEWQDGNPDNEDRVGYSVQLVGNQVIKSLESSENVIGVVSGNPSFVGDSAWNFWTDKYVKDDFNRRIWEDYNVIAWDEIIKDDRENEKIINHSFAEDEIPEGIIIPENHTVIKEKREKLNPNFNKNLEYVNRENRPEWSTIGLVGKLRLRKGQPVNPRWIKMRDISDSVEEWYIR